MLAKKRLQIPDRGPPVIRHLIGYVAGIALVALFGLFLAWRPIQMVRLTRDVEQLNKLKAELIEINARLKVERATLSRLDRIEKLARGKYGFIDPDKNQDFFVSQP